ncbi:MAG TPA: HAMP domain-containing protein [Streptosporangiaceae bacterium]|nr:HAMP domain-containing protein [Streptosporangiaceae bacterium]
MWHQGFRRGQAIARLLARPSLQVRLVAITLCLVAAGAGIISAASGLVARGYLMRQADQQLRAYADRLTSRPFTATPMSRVAPGASAPGGPGGAAFSIEVRGPAGQLIMSAGPGTPAGQAIPAAAARLPARAGQLATRPAVSGGGSWLVIAEPIHYRARRIPFTYSAEDFSLLITSRARPGHAGTLVIGLGLASIGRAVGRLTITCLAVSGVAILVVACLGAMVIRAILRPLTQMEETAGAIAAGELSCRIPDRRARSDASSLASSLNRMLSQLEQALNTTARSAAAARSSGERMRQTIADTSHELRRPLSVLHGLAEYYRQRGQLSTGELDRMMKQVADEAARMDMLVNDLLLTRHDQPRPPQR